MKPRPTPIERTRPARSVIRELAVDLKVVKLIVLMAFVALLANWNLHAQESAEQAPPKADRPAAKAGGEGKRKTNIDFEDELVEGELKKPELFYLLQKKQFNFKRLIKLRENFLPEMRRDADEIRRGRSKN